MKIRTRRFLAKFRKRIAIGLVVLAGLGAVVTNLDKIATTWIKYFGESAEIVALVDAVNHSLPPPIRSNVELELVQSPKDQSDSQIFDVYLKSKSKDDLLLTSMTYGNGFSYLSAGINGSEKFLPDSSYKISVNGAGKQSVALSPPYLLKANSRGAIRFTFSSEDRTLSSALAFELYDSTGSKVAAVNRFFGQ